MYIRVGEHHLYTEEETEQLFRPLKTVIHAHFDTDTIGNITHRTTYIPGSLEHHKALMNVCRKRHCADQDLQQHPLR